MIILYPKAIKKSKKVSILENDRRGFVTLSDHCTVLLTGYLSRCWFNVQNTQWSLVTVQNDESQTVFLSSLGTWRSNPSITTDKQVLRFGHNSDHSIKWLEPLVPLRHPWLVKIWKKLWAFLHDHRSRHIHIETPGYYRQHATLKEARNMMSFIRAYLVDLKKSCFDCLYGNGWLRLKLPSIF